MFRSGLLLLFMVLHFSYLLAQTAQPIPKRPRTLQIYTGFSLGEEILSTRYDVATGERTTQAERTFAADGFSLGLTVPAPNDRAFHQFDVAQLVFNRRRTETFQVDNDPNVIEGLAERLRTDHRIHLRYSRNAPLRDADERVQIYLGIGGLVYFEAARFQPSITTAFPERRRDLGLRAQLIPRIRFPLNERLFVESFLPISVAELELDRLRIENPLLPEEQQIEQSFLFDFFPPAFEFRVGLGVVL